MPPPVILLAFANEREDDRRYLRNLPRELHLLRQALEKAEDRQLCELVILSNATLNDLLSTFQREKYRNRIAVFHYGGHAGSYELLLEETSGKTRLAYGEGLVPFLSAQKGLKLIFLNGCFSHRQAEELTDSGIPAVIGTVNAVNDEIATELAAAFYSALGAGIPLDEAWEESIFRVRSKTGSQGSDQYYQVSASEGSHRDIVIDFHEKRDRFPWQLLVREGAESIRDWNLPAAAQDPYFGLPDISSRYYLPDVPYRFLERYRKEDARIFFGRGNYIRDIYHRLAARHGPPVLLLYGQSGVGKSSLLEAGVLPRLETEFLVRYVRRDPEKGLPVQLANTLDISAPGQPSPDLLRDAWQKLERVSDKEGLILIMDQAEEVFTRPNDNLPDELGIFMQLVAGIFNQAEGRPRGKLLLSYRKEYDPEIDKACRQATIPKEKIFLDRLDRKGIIEIIGGLASEVALRNKYRLAIEKDLPVVIADDLLLDRDSPITPVLKIILTRLWQLEEKKDERQFTIEAYNHLLKNGILLDDFFHQQMEQIKTWEEKVSRQVVSSGLALDVLHFHTTQLGTAESRSLDELRALYPHQSDILEQLITRFKSVYLLSGLDQIKTALAHDTLAPIVRRELNTSEKPGQRAFRILASKIIDYEQSPEKTYIDEEDLALVEKGAAGMRIWTRKEEELIEKSRQRRAKLNRERRRNQRLKIGGVIAIVLLAFIIFYQLLETRKQAQVNSFLNEARRLEKTDATRAMAFVKKALQTRSDDEAVLQAFNDIYSTNEFYEDMIAPHPGVIRDIQYTYDSDEFLTIHDSIYPFGQNHVYVWKASALQQTKPAYHLPHDFWIHSAVFSKNGQFILTAGEDSIVRLWDKEREEITDELYGKGHFYTAVFSPDEERIFAGNDQGEIFVWDRKSPEPVINWSAHDGAVSRIVLLPEKSILFTAGLKDGYIHQWAIDEPKKPVLINSFYQESVTVLTMAYDSLDAYWDNTEVLLAGYSNGTVGIWDILSGENMFLKCHEGQVNKVLFSPDHQFFFTAGDYMIQCWDRVTLEKVKSYKGHEDIVYAFDVLNDEYGEVNTILSGGADRHLRKWRFRCKIKATYFDESFYSDYTEYYNEICWDADFSADGRLMLVAGEKKASLLDSNLNVLQTFTAHHNTIRSVAVSPDNQLFLTGSEDGTAILWNVEGVAVDTFRHEGPVYSVAFSPDGRFIATGSGDSTALLIDRNEQRRDILPHPEVVSALTFSPDGKRLLTGCRDGLARLWQDREVVDSVKASTDQISSVAFSPDGRYFATGGNAAGYESAGFTIWKSSGVEQLSKEVMNNTQDGARAVHDMAFSPDSRFILVAQEGLRAELFRLDGLKVAEFNDFDQNSVLSACFSPENGKFILFGVADGSARLFYNPLQN